MFYPARWKWITVDQKQSPKKLDCSVFLGATWYIYILCSARLHCGIWHHWSPDAHLSFKWTLWPWRKCPKVDNVLPFRSQPHYQDRQPYVRHCPGSIRRSSRIRHRTYTLHPIHCSHPWHHFLLQSMFNVLCRRHPNLHLLHTIW